MFFNVTSIYCNLKKKIPLLRSNLIFYRKYKLISCTRIDEDNNYIHHRNSHLLHSRKYCFTGLRWIDDGMAIGWSQARPRNVRTEGVHHPFRHVDASRSAPDGSLIEKNVSRCRRSDRFARGTRSAPHSSRLH